MTICFAGLFAGAVLAASTFGEAIPVGDPGLMTLLEKAFPGFGVRMQGGNLVEGVSVSLEGQQMGGSENIEVKQEVVMDLSGGTRAMVFSVSMVDRLNAMREAIERQQYGEHRETAYLLLAIESRDGQMVVSRLCAAASNEVSGAYGDIEELAILGPGRKQLGMTYTSCFQDEDMMGMRQTRFIYDLPLGGEIFRAMIGEAFTGVSEQGIRWRLTYHDMPQSSTKEIHRTSEKGEVTDVYKFNGTKYVPSPVAPISPVVPKSQRDRREFYAKQMEWKGVPALGDVLSEECVPLSGEIVQDEMTDEELLKIVKAGYPDARQIHLVERKMEPSRRGDAMYWSGDVEFMLENADSQQEIRYLVWPARAVLTNGVTLLSGLLFPNQSDFRHYNETSAERITKGETAEAVFACVRMNPHGSESCYRDVIADGFRGIKDAYGARGGFRSEPSMGLFRVIRTHVLMAEKSSTDDAVEPIKEAWYHIYELEQPRLVFKVPFGVISGKTSVFEAGGELQWRDEDGDQIPELLLRNDKWVGYVYKWQQDTFTYWKQGAIKPDPPPYTPKGLNPPIKVTITVEDDTGVPLDGCVVKAEITTKHQNILNIFEGSTPKYQSVTLKTDASGRALLACKAFTVMLEISRPGYVSQKMKLRPYAELVPDTLHITLDKAP